jgi:ketosteroid isomerase-like protein
MDQHAVQRLIDRQAVEETIYRYASAIDVKDYTTLRTLFADDVVAQYATAPEIRGADALVGWIEEMSVDQAFQHHMINVYHVDLDGDEARAMTYHTSHQTRVGDPDTVLLIVGRYRDVLRRIDGAWKIAEKRMETGWMEERHFSQTAAADREAADNLAAQDRARSGR